MTDEDAFASDDQGPADPSSGSPFFGDEAPAPGDPGTAGAALADLASGGGDGSPVPEYSPYYGAPAESWSTDRFESIMRDTIDAQANEQRQLEQLLRDVRAALDTPRGDDGGAELLAAQLTAELAAVRDEQSQRFAALASQVEQVTATVAGLVTSAPGEHGPTLQDVHDGLAGVRTDMASLPDLLGPAVTSAVSHGVAQTTAHTSARLAPLQEAVAGVPQLADRLAQLGEQLAGLESALQARLDAGPATAATVDTASPVDIAALVDERLSARIDALHAGLADQLAEHVAPLAERLDALSSAGVAASAPAVAAPADAADLDDRFAALHDELREMRLAAEGPTAATTSLEERLGAVLDELRAMRLAQGGPGSAETTVVAQLHASEQRLAHHVDEAVLALAQAVLRRRAVSPPPYAGSSPLVPGSTSPGAADPASGSIEESAEQAPEQAEEPAHRPEQLLSELLHDDLTDATAADTGRFDDGPPPSWLPAEEVAAAEADAAAHAGLEAWTKGDPAPRELAPEVHLGDAPPDEPAGEPGEEPVEEPAAGSAADEADDDADDHELDALVPSPDVLPGRHRPGGGDKRGLFRRKA